MNLAKTPRKDEFESANTETWYIFGNRVNWEPRIRRDSCSVSETDKRNPSGGRVS